MNKVCVYTCITGDYDYLKDYKYRDENFDYICFTNNKTITSNFWKVIYVDEAFDNLTLARKIKILGHKELNKYDYTIWLDGAMQLRKPLSDFINECCDLDKYDMIGFNHRKRDCIYDEINECVFLFKESVENAKCIENFLKKEKYPKHNGLIESTVLIRKNNKNVKNLMDLWFQILIKYSRRDQLSFNYCLWKNPIRINMLNMNVFDNDYFVHEGHCNVKFSRKYRVYLSREDSIGFKNIIDGFYEFVDGKFCINFQVPFDCDSIELMISPYDCVILKDFYINTKCNIIFDSIELGENKIFLRYNNIILKKNFKKNESILISLDMLTINIDDFFKYNYNFFKQNCEYKEKYDSLVCTHEDLKKQMNFIINSKGWKFLEKIRRFKKQIWKWFNDKK